MCRDSRIQLVWVGAAALVVEAAVVVGAGGAMVVVGTGAVMVGLGSRDSSGSKSKHEPLLRTTVARTKR